jgi:hypothetical protein
MERFLFVSIVLAAVLWTDVSHAQGRWCAVVSQGRSVREICHFRDFEACRLEVVSGNRGFCRPSQYWSGSQHSPRKSSRKRSKR